MTADFALSLAGYGSFFLTTALSYALICLGLNLQWGQTGLFNVGVAGFVGIGAYASALLTTPATEAHWGGFGLPIAAGWLGAMLIAGAASALIGFATLRLRSDYLAITTFGVAVTIHLVALNAQTLTGGPYGVAFIPPAVRRFRRSAAVVQRPQSGAGRRPGAGALCRARAPRAQPVGPRAARDPRGREGGGLARQEPGPPPPASLRARRRDHGAGGAVQAHFIGFNRAG